MSVATRILPEKYRVIVLAVAFFLVFDLAVLVLNFYTSFQIGQDALAINLAGRQRMLSQRMTKAVISIETDLANGESSEQSVAELKKTVKLFDGTLSSFRSGGIAIGGDDQPVELAAVASQEGQQILDRAYGIWTPYLQTLHPFLASSVVSDEQRADAVRYARANNLALLGLMNDLTTNLERVAAGKAERLRWVQTIGIMLALLNFAFILFKFIRQLEESDRRTESARQETEEILSTVKEGLFLLDGGYRLGNQYSASLNTILQREVWPGIDFFGVLQDMVSAQTLTATKDYVELLFGNRVKEGLVLALNPLSEVEVKVGRAGGNGASRYLSFQFNRVAAGGRVSHLLVTVQDVTDRVSLAAQLNEAKSQARVELDVLLKLLRTEPATLRGFLKTMEATLLQINARLKRAAASTGEDPAQIVNQAFRASHAIKGEAAALGLEMLENLIHGFEKELVALRDRGNPSGDDMVGLVVRLDDLFERLVQVKEVTERIGEFATRTDTAPPDEAAKFLNSMQTLATRIAASQDKQVRISAELDACAKLPDTLSGELRNIAIQLLRNAISHGIEPASERATVSKSVVGNIYIGCKQAQDGTFEFTLRDDGRGLVPARIREALVRTGRYPREQLAKLDDRDLVMKIFEPGFSTAPAAHKDAGHGMGMAVIREKIESIGGRLRLSTRPNHFTEFSIRFAHTSKESEVREPAARLLDMGMGVS